MRNSFNWHVERFDDGIPNVEGGNSFTIFLHSIRVCQC